MKYVIHNVLDSGYNIQGLKYSVLEDRLLKEGDSVPEYPKKECIRMEFDAPYESELQHEAHLMKALEATVKHAIENKSLNDCVIRFQVHKFK